MGSKVAVALLVALALICIGTVQARNLQDLEGDVTATKQDNKFTGELWALLIAGSAGWGNYRHQADVYHAYQILKRGGVDDDHIIVMHTNDLAGNWMNPHPGRVFNRPGGPDLYKGVPLDYTGEHVTTENFLAALLGEPGPAVLGTSGKLIKSGPKDRVFVYFADHGAPGLLGMPTGDYLYADQIQKTLKAKQKNKGFADLVFYVEACESGSIFEGLLEDDLEIYAVTAANAYESSWGTYCPGMTPGPEIDMNTCLGDLFSVAFLENCDTKNETLETLLKQYDLVKLRTSNNDTYQQGSHVLQFGDLDIDEEPVADYFSNVAKSQQGAFDASNDFSVRFASGGQGAVLQRDADLLHLWTVFQRAQVGAKKTEAQAALTAEISKRSKVDREVREATRELLSQPAILSMLYEKYAGSNLLLPRLDENLAAVNVPLNIEEQFVSAPLPRAAGLPLVDDWDCLRAMMKGWGGFCGRLDQYGMQYSRLFANMCNAGISVDAITDAAQKVCIPDDDGSWETVITDGATIDV